MANHLIVIRTFCYNNANVNHHQRFTTIIRIHLLGTIYLSLNVKAIDPIAPYTSYSWPNDRPTLPQSTAWLKNLSSKALFWPWEKYFMFCCQLRHFHDNLASADEDRVSWLKSPEQSGESVFVHRRYWRSWKIFLCQLLNQRGQGDLDWKPPSRPQTRLFFIPPQKK